MKIAHGTVVMVADAKKFVLFKNEGDEEYPVLSTVAHEEIENPPTHEQGSDRPGRSFSSTGARRSSYEQTDWHDQAEQRFARHVADMLQRTAEHSESKLVVIAPPRLLGELRKHLHPTVTSRIAAEIPKDLVHHVTDDVVRAISAHGS